ncbi:hypothetical protein DENIT_60469 [Pseudomonas veronii]|nr:hypothetical protein DENIT_60469 [Pseudomonas veronii]
MPKAHHTEPRAGHLLASEETPAWVEMEIDNSHKETALRADMVIYCGRCRAPARLRRGRYC